MSDCVSLVINELVQSELSLRWSEDLYRKEQRTPEAKTVA